MYISLDRLINQQLGVIGCGFMNLDSEEYKHLQSDILEALEELRQWRSLDLINRADVINVMNNHMIKYYSEDNKEKAEAFNEAAIITELTIPKVELCKEK